MDIAQMKLDLMQRLMMIRDEAALSRVAKVIEKEGPVAIEEDDDLTDEEVAELEQRFQDMVSGKVKSVSAKDSIGLIRAAAKE